MNVKNELDDILYQVSNPERYIGNEWNQIVKDWEKTDVKVALAFPDVYEIGMSHLGIKIIYHLLNNDNDILCERAFAPWFDLEEIMREKDLPLYTLESGREIQDFDILGFTLQYEMSYTNILNMIDLAGMPVYSKDRDESYPLIIGGGSTVFNPEPIAPFFDLFYIGEAEEGIASLVKHYKRLQKDNKNRKEILIELNKMPGVYVPSLYEAEYDNKQFVDINPAEEGVKSEVKRQIVSDLDNSFYPTDFIVPYMDIVHDRAVLEISRGCTRGCRFCAAGMTYRPVRERSKETLLDLAGEILASTGYGEISLTSLSTMDYSQVDDLVKTMADRYSDLNISISLSSLRVDEFSVKLAREVQRVRKTGLTFAPEAGTQRLRNIINKGVEEENLYDAVRAAFESGWHRIKLYFMIGLPTEEREDLDGIIEMAHKVRKIGREIRKNTDKRMKRIDIQVSVSTYVPKPYTPFQWVRMINKEEIEEKIFYLRDNIRGRGLKFSWNEPDLSLIEGVVARGDRRIANVIYDAWQKGSQFDSWNQKFSSEKWFQALEENDLELDDYLSSSEPDNKLPWSHINLGVGKEFLKKECERAFSGELTEDCRTGRCTDCDVCFDFDAQMEIIGDDNNEDD